MAKTVDYRVSTIVILCKDCGQDVGLYPARHQCEDIERPHLPPLPAIIPDVAKQTDPQPGTEEAKNESTLSSWSNALGRLTGKTAAPPPPKKEEPPESVDDNTYFDYYSALLPEEKAKAAESKNSWTKVKRNDALQQLVDKQKQQDAPPSTSLWGKIFQGGQKQPDRPNSDESDWDGESHVSRTIRQYHESKTGQVPDWFEEEIKAMDEELAMASDHRQDDAVVSEGTHKKHLWDEDPLQQMTARERERQALRDEERRERDRERAATAARLEQNDVDQQAELEAQQRERERQERDQLRERGRQLRLQRERDEEERRERERQARKERQEQERRDMLEEEEKRLRQEEADVRRRQLEAEERRRQKEDEERRQRDAEDRRHREAEERRRQREAEEQRRQQEAEERRRQKEAEERKRQQEIEKQRQQDAERRQRQRETEERQRQRDAEERQRRDADDRRRQREADDRRQRLEEDDRRRAQDRRMEQEKEKDRYMDKGRYWKDTPPKKQHVVFDEQESRGMQRSKTTAAPSRFDSGRSGSKHHRIFGDDDNDAEPVRGPRLDRMQSARRFDGFTASTNKASSQKSSVVSVSRSLSDRQFRKYTPTESSSSFGATEVTPSNYHLFMNKSKDAGSHRPNRYLDPDRRDGLGQFH